MSAKFMRLKFLVASTLFAALCVVPHLHAEPAGGNTAPADKTQPTVVKPMTREDVELVLREARGAIAQGKFEDAEKLISKAEAARIHYSMFHFGPTPVSVRRELNRARRTAGKGAAPATNERPSRLPFNPISEKDDATNETTVDPFSARGRSTAPAAAPIPSGQDAGSEIPDHEPSDPAMQVQRLPSPANGVLNPFAKEETSGAAPSRYEVQPAQANVSPNERLAQQAGGDISWRLPGPQAQAASDEASAAPMSGSPRMAAANSASEPSAGAAKQQAIRQMAEARKALDAGNVEKAEELSRAVNAMAVPESEFLPDEDRPSLLAWDIVAAKKSQVDPKPMSRASTPTSPAYRPAESARYADRSVAEAAPAATQKIAGQQTQNGPPAAPKNPAATAAEELPVPDFESPLPKPLERTLLGAESAAAPAPVGKTSATGAPVAPSPPSSLLDKADESQQVLARQLSAEIGKRQSEAKRLHEKDPERAVAILREAQQLVKDSKLPESSKRELLARIDITLNQTESYVKQHGADIELEKQNEKVLQTIDREREVKRKIKQEIADGIEEFNKLRDEHRYAEMEIVARRLYELDPTDPTTQQVLQTAKFIRREMLNREISMQREEGNDMAYRNAEEAGIIEVGDGKELIFDQKYWTDFTAKRTGSQDRMRKRTERELEIEKRLKMPVQLRYEGTPLSQVIDELSKLAGINIYLDPLGLGQEGVNTDTTVDLPLNKEISLESALRLILEPLHLSYVVKDDVLKITSEQLCDGEIYPVTYNVADLVIPIPNFVPSSNIGLQGLINEAQSAANTGQRALGGGPTALVSNNGQRPGSSATDQILAQQFNPAPSGGLSPATVPIGSGPGGMGAGANADFDSLIDLIVSTVETGSWAENGGGEAEIRPFPTNLSLVISQTQDVHRQIADLLEQLRRLQDLQVTIEVRFIRLNDTFFERIGVDFDMDINDTGFNGDPLTTDLQPFGPRSNTVGAVRQATGDLPAFTTDLDIPFRQDSFAIATPPAFAGFDPNSAARIGFAILSDIEAYFLIEAAQGDRRTNVLNAPKVTLFNGQQAFVSDSTQRPFVVGVIPVVGEFAAAQQPVIVVLNEGTMMTIQAVVSEDRRYVRMTIVPFFTQIGDVDEFTFEGSSSSTSSSSSSDDDEDGKKESEEESEEETRSGVTVQLPSFSFVSVVTTVSVPDGGTVLLGGIKRLSEGRNEFGVPLLSKVPYVNRLFRNVGIGRSTDSLMMMVTPRIIIQEEEEERLGIQVP